MRLTPALILALALAAPAAAQAPQPGQPMVRMRPPSPPPVFSGEAADVAMILVEGRPTVEVEVGGRKLRFMVDTGATGQALIRADIAEAMGLVPTGIVRAGDPSGRFQERKAYRLPSLKLGGLTFQDVGAVEFVPPPDRFAGIDGIVGVRTYADLLLTLDYGRGRLKLEKGELPASALSYEIEGPGAITIPVTVGGETLKAHLDTGNARAPLMLPKDQFERHAKPGAIRSDGVGSTLVSTVELFSAELAEPVRVGGVTLPVKTIASPSLGPTGNLGSLALVGAVVRLDQKNRRVSIEVPKPVRSRGA